MFSEIPQYQVELYHYNKTVMPIGMDSSLIGSLLLVNNHFFSVPGYQLFSFIVHFYTYARVEKQIFT